MNQHYGTRGDGRNGGEPIKVQKTLESGDLDCTIVNSASGLEKRQFSYTTMVDGKTNLH